MTALARLKIVILGWAGVSVFFTAVLEISELGHKPLGFALYSNAVHFALWALALPLFTSCVRPFPLKDPKRIRNAEIRLILIAVLAMLVDFTHWAIVYPTYFPQRSSLPTFQIMLRSDLFWCLPNEILIGIVLVTAIEGWQVLQDLQAERMRAMDLERQLAVSRLEALRMQLHPRPLAPNENIFLYEKLAHMRGRFLVLSLGQNDYKRFGVHAFYVHMAGVRSDGGFRGEDTSGAANPQSSYSEQGVSSRVNWQTSGLFGLMGNVKLPLKAELSTELFASSGRPYNITTGTDVPRNIGTMPGTVHLDTNLSRSFTLPGSKEHPRTFTFSARSANLLNHTNVTAVNTILSSGAAGQPVAAETARRVKLGIRFAF